MEFSLSLENASEEHFSSKEVSGCFLRLSLEETLAFNFSRLVREEVGGAVVGTYCIRSLMSSNHCLFIFLLFHTLICFYFSFGAR